MDNDCHVRTILIIDDESEICITLTRLLAMKGYQVSAAESGQEGLNLARKGDPDLIFVDLGLPDISGWDVARTIKNANRRAKVVLTTGRALQLTVVEAGERGVDFILSKPFTFSDVLDALASLSVGESF